MARRPKLPSSEVKGENAPSAPEAAWKARIRTNDYLGRPYPMSSPHDLTAQPQPDLGEANLKDGIVYREKL